MVKTELKTRGSTVAKAEKRQDLPTAVSTENKQAVLLLLTLKINKRFYCC